MRKLCAAMSIAMAMAGGVALAQEDTIEEMASEAEVASVNETIAKIGCEAEEVEKESPTLFELDDAECAIGQYDIKLDENFNIISMTRDE
ncbi:MAG: hypothetical protein DI556_05880 [Rhodovulum sulfidophilum]|uniref:PepSY domain-containing protein n=1 Tax=Rhodovulum sulfidophilum TaxID=35806 RepID=A0A2W5QJM3_RHOSU|nr:MAG: hypothetical protein DI556_05880 [Rhodovulum sulfidophilum]